MLAKTSALPEALGKAKIILSDNGLFSEANAKSCSAAGIEPLIAPGRQNHHPTFKTDAPAACVVCAPASRKRQ